MAYHVPEEETLGPLDLQALQRRKLAALFARLLPDNRFYAEKFAGLDFDPACDPLERLPLTTRAEIQNDQAAHPPYGRNLTFPVERYCRMHQTSGSTGTPLRWLDTAEDWAWWKRCWAVVLRAAGLTDDDRLMFPFSFGPFVGFWAAFESAVDLGNFCLPGGGMSTSARLRHLLDHRITVVCCTPTYALRLIEVALSEGLDLPGSPVRSLIVGGEPGACIPTVRSRIESGWGARLFDHAGMTEVGAWGFQTPDDATGMYLIESEFMAEVIDPQTLELVDDAEPGELVLTNLGRFGSPLIRYRTGDRVLLTRNVQHGGRWFARLEGGILGRTDDMICIRGNNVFPAAVEGILRGFSEIVEFRLEVDETGPMADLRIELEPATPAAGSGLAERVAEAVSDRLSFRPRVEVVPPGALPRFEMKAKRLIRRGRPKNPDGATDRKPGG
ncbi:MAG: AMP-binding protein [Planctomycetes bacterium]|nr:AMP-binding protein [Planctomycetota bacterium]